MYTKIKEMLEGWIWSYNTLHDANKENKSVFLNNKNTTKPLFYDNDNSTILIESDQRPFS